MTHLAYGNMGTFEGGIAVANVGIRHVGGQCIAMYVLLKCCKPDEV